MDDKYLAPITLVEVAEKIDINSGNVSILAGGTDLLAQWNCCGPTTGVVVDVKNVEELTEIRAVSDGLRIGAAVTCSRIFSNSEVAEAYPGLKEAANLVGSKQIRNRATLGGNLCNASPAADTVSSLIVNQATCKILSVRGERYVPVEDFLLGPGKSILKENEFLVRIDLPKNKPCTADAYLRITPRAEMDIAIAGAAVKLSLDASGVCDGARVAISGVAPRVLRVPEAEEALIGSKLESAVIEALQEAVRNACDPITDIRARAEYRRHVVGILAKRSSKLAFRRAYEESIQ